MTAKKFTGLDDRMRIGTLFIVVLLITAGCAAFRLKENAETMLALEREFYLAKQCTGLTMGEFSDVDVVLMPVKFDCPYDYFLGCGGEFSQPNIIKVGRIGIMRHETIHYLLYRNTGDADTDHKSPLFAKCG